MSEQRSTGFSLLGRTKPAAAPPRNEDQQAAMRTLTSLVAAGMRVMGPIEIEQGLKVDGHVVGSVTYTGSGGALLLVKDGASVEGDVVFDRIWVAGTVRGNIKGREVRLFPSARLEGNVFYERLQMADGAQVFGYMCCGLDQRVPAQPIATPPAANTVVTHPAAVRSVGAPAVSARSLQDQPKPEATEALQTG